MKRIFLITLALLILLSTQAFSLDDSDLQEIREAIKEKGASWQAGKSKLWQMSDAERAKRIGAEIEPIDDSERIMPERKFSGERESTLDWRDMNGNNYVTPVKDQADCGSCMAFSSVGALESRIAINHEITDPTLDLSEQYMVSCGPVSCIWGGNTWSACNFLQTDGVPTEDCLPYEAIDGNCSDRCDDYALKARKIDSWNYVYATVSSIKNALEGGTVGASYTVYEDFYAYEGGVYEHVWGEADGGHAVLIVGYQDSTESWICKNSWGDDWGEDGYFRIAWGEVGINNSCYRVIPSDPVYPDIDFVSYSIQDNVDGDNDGILNPGETATLTVTITNQLGWADATGITASLMSDDDRLTIDAGETTYPDLAAGESANNDTDLQITISSEMDLTPIPITLHIEANDGSDFYYVNLNFDLEISLNQAGWPLTMTENVRTSPLPVDIDGDGNKEVIFGSNDKNLYVKSANGMDVEGFPFTTDGIILSSPAAGDVDADGDMEILVNSFDSNLYIIENDGELMQNMEIGLSSATPVLSDLDNDGDLEIILGTTMGALNVIHHTGDSYSDAFPYYFDAGILTGVAIADLDVDGQKDIVVGCLDGGVYALSMDGELLDGFPYETGGNIRSAPSVSNFDGAGNKIVVGSVDNNVYIINADGSLFSQIETGDEVVSSPAFADVDRNGSIEFFFGSNDGKIYGLDSNGNHLENWPQTVDAPIHANPVFSDLDNDNQLEIIFPTLDGNLHVFTPDGSTMAPFPMNTGNDINASNAIADIDSDNDLELIYVNNYSVGILDFKWESEEEDLWRIHRANMHRTGFHGDLGESSVEEMSITEAPMRYNLGANYPNPFNPTTTIQFALPEKEAVELNIYDISGKLVKTLIHSEKDAGYHSVVWNGKDDTDKTMPSGIYLYRIQTEKFSDTKRCILLK